MEDKLKLAEIKGYVECCLNKFNKINKIPTDAPYSFFYKDLNAILDIIMDKQIKETLKGALKNE